MVASLRYLTSTTDRSDFFRQDVAAARLRRSTLLLSPDFLFTRATLPAQSSRVIATLPRQSPLQDMSLQT